MNGKIKLMKLICTFLLIVPLHGQRDYSLQHATIDIKSLVSTNDPAALAALKKAQNILQKAADKSIAAVSKAEIIHNKTQQKRSNGMINATIDLIDEAKKAIDDVIKINKEKPGSYKASGTVKIDNVLKDIVDDLDTAKKAMVTKRFETSQF